MNDQPTLDDPGIAIPPRGCDADTALDVAIQHARRATQLAVSHNPTSRNHSLAAAGWAQVAVALLVRDGAQIPTPVGEGRW